MIELGKKYVTRDGREVRVFALDGGGDFPVIGAMINTRSEPGTARLITNRWTAEGFDSATPGRQSSADLIEVKPKITATYWLLHWINSDWHATVGPTREYLDQNFRKDERLAITGPHHVEFTEGEGLEPSR